MTNRLHKGSSVRKHTSTTDSYQVIATETSDGFPRGLYLVEHEQYRRRSLIPWRLEGRVSGPVRAEVRIFEHVILSYPAGCDYSTHDYSLPDCGYALVGEYIQYENGRVEAGKKITCLKDPSALEFMLTTALLPQEVREIISRGQTT